MLENTWIPLSSFVIVQHLNDTAGSDPFERNGHTAIEGDCDSGKAELFFRQHDGNYLTERRRGTCRSGGGNTAIIITDRIFLSLFNTIAPSGHTGTHTSRSGMLLAANIG